MTEATSGLGALLCDGPIWDPSLFWDSDRPRLTLCFRRLVLTTVPCATFWLTVILDAAFRWRSGHDHSCGPCPWTLIAICKQVLTCCLILCTVVEGSYHLYEQKMDIDMRVEYLSVCVKLLTYMLAFYIQIRQRRQGRLSSMKLTLFWTLLTACEFFASPLYELITDDFSELTDEVLFVVGILSLSLVVSEAFLSQFTDPQYDVLFCDTKTDEYLLDHLAPLSRLLFSWMNRLMKHGYKNILSVDDLDALKPDIRTSYVCTQFTKSWSKEEEIAEKAKKNKLRWWHRGPSLCLALIRVMWPWLLSAVCLELVYDFLSLAPPIILDWLIKYMEDEDKPWWHGLLYSFLLFASAFLSGQLIAHTQNFLIRASIIPRSGLYATIYRKVFRLNMASRRGYSAGEICNLVTVDVMRIFQLVWSANTLWSNPLRIALTMALLWRYLGVACVAGLGALVALMPLTAFIAVQTHKYQAIQMRWKDSRLRQMNEILNGIKVLKLFAWELPFMHRVEEVRALETKALRRLAFLNGLVVFTWILAPFLVAISSFVTFVLLDEHNVLDPSIAFVSLTLFGKLRSAMSPIPQVLSDFVQSRIAFKRVAEFLLCEELDTSEQDETISPGNDLELENASFSWGADDVFLLDLTLSIQRGDLVAVVGRVGAGKSALLAAILGEMTRHQGTFRMKRNLRIAYVSQTAWIQNASLRQNILFVSAMDKRRYDSVIRRCCLGPDLKLLPEGDHTEIGEKGVNLSGGQKQRVNVARAVYYNADFYLLDDPLSAVDAHVSKTMFSEVIGPKGTLAHKTRILVTHDLSVLPHCNMVVLMSDGRIVEAGSYRDLLKKSDGQLTKLVHEIAQQKEPEDTPPSPDPTLLTTEELKTQMRRMGSRLSRTTSVDDLPVAKPTRFIEKERMELGRVQFDVYCSYFRSAGLIMASLVFAGFAAFQAFEIGANVWLSRWSVDQPLPDGTQDIHLRNFRIGVYGSLGFAQGACILFGSLTLAIAATRASIRLHCSMLRSVMRSPLRFFETTPLGRILNRFGKDIQGVDVGIPKAMNGVISAMASAAGTLVVISLNYPYFLLILIPIAIVYIFVQVFYIATSRQLRRLMSVTLSPVLSFFSESIQGTSTIRAFGCQAVFTRRQDSHINNNCKVFLNSTFVNRWLGVRLQLMGAVIVFVVALLAVFGRPAYSVAVVGLTLSYTLNVTDILGQLVRILTQLETQMVSVERIDEYSKLEKEASWTTEQCNLSLSDWPSEGHISFSGYKMRYRHDSDLVLKGIDLDIPAGQKVGVVGRTGAGKSSLAQALFRVVEPSEGYLFIDNIDIATLGLHDLRSRLTVIPQDPVLFGGSLRINLDPMERHTDRELMDALLMARMEVPAHGLDMHLEEGGENLSVGQRQQVCLARALLQKSRILVLDEATAAVDLETDRLIQETIREQFRQCTVITVAHRLHTVLDYDRILVMERGRIVEDGPPDALLKRADSLFKDLARAAGLL